MILALLACGDPVPAAQPPVATPFPPTPVPAPAPTPTPLPLQPVAVGSFDAPHLIDAPPYSHQRWIQTSIGYYLSSGYLLSPDHPSFIATTWGTNPYPTAPETQVVIIDLDNSEDRTFAAWAYLGMPVELIPDQNGDGLEELILGACCDWFRLLRFDSPYAPTTYVDDAVWPPPDAHFPVGYSAFDATPVGSPGDVLVISDVGMIQMNLDSIDGSYTLVDRPTIRFGIPAPIGDHLFITGSAVYDHEGCIFEFGPPDQERACWSLQLPGFPTHIDYVEALACGELVEDSPGEECVFFVRSEIYDESVVVVMPPPDSVGGIRPLVFFKPIVSSLDYWGSLDATIGDLDSDGHNDLVLSHPNARYTSAQAQIDGTLPRGRIEVHRGAP